MSDKAINWIIKITFGLGLLLLAAGVWYYTLGRKPRVLVSAPIKAHDSKTSLHTIAPNEVLLLVGTKATLYDLALKRDRWSIDLNATTAAKPVATPAPLAVPKATPPPAPVAQEKPDPLLAARVKKRFAKLEKWAAELNDKRGKLKTQLQIDAFNVEAAKYHAELLAARTEAGTATPAPAHTASHELADESEDWIERYASTRTEIAAFPSSVWIAQGHRVTGLDRADGHVLKVVTLPGNVSSIERGAEELFVLASVGQGRDLQLTRIVPSTGSAQNLTVAIPPEPHEEEWHEGSPRKPTTPEHRILFSTHRSSLLQLDVRLIERKLTERQTMTGEAGSDLEAADKKTTGGFGNDALLMAQALNKEAERDATGGKEIIDESTYEVSLQRPFTPALPAATAQVHGHAEVFSTPSLDLIAAGKELVAFDHSNKKLWQAQLAQPIAAISRFASSDDEDASPAHPCLEAGDRLYFFDTAYLTAFARQTGQPAWRLPLKGIHKIQLDDADQLYVSSRPGGFNEPAQLLRVEAKTGRVVWKVEKYDDCFVSGRDLYVTRETRNAEDAVNSVFDRSKAIQCRWKLYKLSSRNGEPQWEWFQTRRPSRVDADHKHVALLFPDELQVVTSIAL